MNIFKLFKYFLQQFFNLTFTARLHHSFKQTGNFYVEVYDTTSEIILNPRLKKKIVPHLILLKLREINKPQLYMKEFIRCDEDDIFTN